MAPRSYQVKKNGKEKKKEKKSAEGEALDRTQYHGSTRSSQMQPLFNLFVIKAKTRLLSTRTKNMSDDWVTRYKKTSRTKNAPLYVVA
jgi:hypothetical protein